MPPTRSSGIGCRNANGVRIGMPKSQSPMAVRKVDLPASLGPTTRWMSRSLAGNATVRSVNLPYRISLSSRMRMVGGFSRSRR